MDTLLCRSPDELAVSSAVLKFRPVDPCVCARACVFCFFPEGREGWSFEHESHRSGEHEYKLILIIYEYKLKDLQLL